MARWMFFGRVLPERFPITWPEAIKFTSEAVELGIKFDIEIKIAESQFVALVDLHAGPNDVTTLKNLVEGNVQKLVDLAGYLHGGAFNTETIGAHSDDGTTVFFGNTIPILKEARDASHMSIQRDFLTAIVMDAPAQIVLADFREAMRHAVTTGFFCYRAVEAMMQSMKKIPTDPDGPAWEVLRNELQVHRAAIDAIKAHADYPRHGKIFAITDAERANVFRLTDQIIKRYLEYLRRGRKSLPIGDFPLVVP